MEIEKDILLLIEEKFPKLQSDALKNRLEKIDSLESEISELKTMKNNAVTELKSLRDLKLVEENIMTRDKILKQNEEKLKEEKSKIEIEKLTYQIGFEKEKHLELINLVKEIFRSPIIQKNLNGTNPHGNWINFTETLTNS